MTLTVQTGQQTLCCSDLHAAIGTDLTRLPHVLRLLAENHLRNGGEVVDLSQILSAWLAGQTCERELTFRPNRLLMHDTTCTPALADIAGLRDAVAEAGLDPEILSPTLPVDVSVDHSLAVNAYAKSTASTTNLKNEITRNRERYAFMKWASRNMKNVRVNPPGTGIMHTINLEQLATVLVVHPDGHVHPDMLLGADSHTPMINGLGVMGWGIGGLEAESVMFGQSVSLAMPQVVGVKLTDRLRPGITATDLALHITHVLRKFDVAGCFVEFYGPGVTTLSADSRAVVANMAPEYGASTGFFPVDQQTVRYLIRTGRPAELTDTIEPVFRAMGLWFDPQSEPHFDRQIEVDLSTIETSMAGPRRPQDICYPRQARERIEAAIGRNLAAPDMRTVPDGAVGVAAISSCTNTSDPRLLITAGLLARKARSFGLMPKPWVKTSLAPGSPSARAYLARAGLNKDLSAIGFDIVGFGCTTCIGNSGELPDDIEQALKDGRAVTAILSGNRNFPGRVHPKLDLAYLASPPLVVAYALHGIVHGDILNDAIGTSKTGMPVFLADIWPEENEIDAAMKAGFRPTDVPQAFAEAWRGQLWHDIEAPQTAQFPWDPESRTLRRPKFASLNEKCRLGTYSAAPLLVLGDDMTTDHISPAGWVDPDSEAGRWLLDRGADHTDMNVYASYRGNWEVMVRGLFTNRLAVNYLASDLSPAHTILEDGTRLTVLEAANCLAKKGQPVIILAGDRYGMGSSRDWAAKGVALLGVRAVLARSFERIHRTNLIGMGVLPLQFIEEFDPKSADIHSKDRFDVHVAPEGLSPNKEYTIQWFRTNQAPKEIQCRAAVETWQEIEILKKGGILSMILQDKLTNA